MMSSIRRALKSALKEFLADVGLDLEARMAGMCKLVMDAIS